MTPLFRAISLMGWAQVFWLTSLFSGKTKIVTLRLWKRLSSLQIRAGCRKETFKSSNSSADIEQVVRVLASVKHLSAFEQQTNKQQQKKHVITVLRMSLLCLLLDTHALQTVFQARQTGYLVQIKLFHFCFLKQQRFSEGVCSVCACVLVFQDIASQKFSMPSPVRTVIAADFDNDNELEVFFNNIAYRGPSANRLFRYLHK